MSQKIKLAGGVLIVVIAAFGFYQWGMQDGLSGSGLSLTTSVEAAGGPVKTRVGVAPDRYVYYPGTEPLGKDEIRLIPLGTGMPAARRSQAATCWLVE